jgi:hypothetical protein
MKKPAEIRRWGQYEYELFNGEYGPTGRGPHGAYDKYQADEQMKLWKTTTEGMTKKVKATISGTEWYFLYVR